MTIAQDRVHHVAVRIWVIVGGIVEDFPIVVIPSLLIFFAMSVVF